MAASSNEGDLKKEMASLSVNTDQSDSSPALELEKALKSEGDVHPLRQRLMELEKDVRTRLREYLVFSVPKSASLVQKSLDSQEELRSKLIAFDSLDMKKCVRDLELFRQFLVMKKSTTLVPP
jgi:hypothetical protein